jgi:hypothetical protein
MFSELPENEISTVAVVGNSHSGVLCCRNLYELAQSGKRSLGIVNFHRQPIRFADYREEGIVYDNSGFKGATAVWARDVMGRLGGSEDGHDILRQVDLGSAHDKETEQGEEGLVYKRELPRCTHRLRRRVRARTSTRPLRRSSTDQRLAPIRHDHLGLPHRRPGRGRGRGRPLRVRDRVPRASCRSRGARRGCCGGNQVFQIRPARPRCLGGLSRLPRLHMYGTAGDGRDCPHGYCHRHLSKHPELSTFCASILACTSTSTRVCLHPSLLYRAT